jgi:hypothetical protein
MTTPSFRIKLDEKRISSFFPATKAEPKEPEKIAK